MHSLNQSATSLSKRILTGGIAYTLGFASVITVFSSTAAYATINSSSCNPSKPISRSWSKLTKGLEAKTSTTTGRWPDFNFAVRKTNAKDKSKMTLRIIFWDGRFSEFEDVTSYTTRKTISNSLDGVPDNVTKICGMVKYKSFWHVIKGYRQ